MKQRIITSSFLACAAVMSWAAPIAFDFKDPKGVNNIVFRTDAPLESINGTGTGISGTVTFDPEHPGTVKGKIILAVASLNVPNLKMKEHLHGSDWMDAARNPEINFELAGTKSVKTEGDNTSAEAIGKLTIKGIKAAFPFYGSGPDKEEDMARITCPVYGFYGGNDARVNATIPKSADLMKKAGKTYEPVTYEGAGHGFMRAGEAPDAAEANKKGRDDGWKRWKELLRKI